MKFPVGTNPVISLPSAQQTEFVGRARSNARTVAPAALNKASSNQASAIQHCRQTLARSATGGGDRGLQNIKTQSPAVWKKAQPSGAMQTSQRSHPISSTHRFPEVIEFAELETLHLEDGDDQVSPKNPAPVDARTPTERPPWKPIFPDLNFFSEPPVPQKIGVIDMPKPQRAVFINPEPAPAPTAANMRLQTVKLQVELAQAKMRVTNLAQPEIPVSGEQKPNET